MGCASSAIQPIPSMAAVEGRVSRRSEYNDEKLTRYYRKDVAVACNNLLVKTITEDDFQALTSTDDHLLPGRINESGPTDLSLAHTDGEDGHIVQNPPTFGELNSPNRNILVTCNNLMVYCISGSKGNSPFIGGAGGQFEPVPRPVPISHSSSGFDVNGIYDHETSDDGEGSTREVMHAAITLDEEGKGSPIAVVNTSVTTVEETSKGRKTLQFDQTDFSEDIENILASHRRNKDFDSSEKKRHQEKLVKKLLLRKKLKEKNNSQEQQELTEPAPLVDLFITPDAKPEAPAPEEPTIKKDTLYSEENTSLFLDLENYAINVENVTSSTFSFSMLMDELLIGRLTDLEKVRILFHWITSQDLNAIKFDEDIPEDTPLFYLRAIKLGKESYASFFLRLCGAAGLHAKVIRGYLKGVGYQPDHKFGGEEDTNRGSWNGVLVDGQWRLIDTHWGSRYVTEDDDLQMEDWKLEYRYEEHYFLTDPDQLINTHFPDESQWQLLRNPLTLQQFEDTVKNWPLLYKLGVHHKSHTSGVVYTDEFGFVRIIIELSSFACSDAKFSANLRTKERKKVINGIPLSQYVLQYTKGSSEIFEAYVPAPGKYQFRINSLSKKFTNENSYTNLCEYQINCTDRKPVVSGSNWSAVPPFPKSSSYYGPGMLVSELNMKPVSHNCPVVQCDGDGRAKVTFQLPPGVVGLKFSQSLYSVYDEENAMKSNSVHTIVKQNGINLVVFRIIAPACGNYCLTLFQKTSSKEDEDKLLTMFCQYLVTSTKQIDGQRYYPFPDIGEYKLGKCDPHFTDVGLDILAYSPADTELNREACVETDSNGKCFIAFSHQKPLTVSGKLFCAAQFPNPKQYIMVETTGKETVFTVKVPASIPKTAPLVLMAYGEITDSEGESIPPVYKVLINHSKATSVNGSALPSSPIGAWGINSNGFNNGLRFQSFSNTEPGVSGKPQKWMTNLPGRIYKGGADVQVNISLKHPMALKAILEPLSNALPDQQYDGLSFVQQSDFTSATVLVRLPHTGEFSVTIYGEKTGTDTLSLSGLGYIHITASQPSRCVRPFPQYFNIWNKSAKHLFSPTTGELVRNKENFVKIKLAQYSLENQQISAYQGTALFSNGACIEPIKSDGCVFEFKYMPGPGEDIVGLVVKPDPNSTSVTYVLQFKVV